MVQRVWPMLIPSEDKLKLLPHSAYCPACLYDKAPKNKKMFFLVGGRPGWTEDVLAVESVPGE